MIKDLPPELDGVVRRFEDQLADVRTRLIRTRAELHADTAPRDEPAAPADHFDFDHPVTSSERR